MEHGKKSQNFSHLIWKKLKKNATKNEIKSSYRALVKKHHPDTGGEKERFIAIQNAWETLNDTYSYDIVRKQITNLVGSA